MDDILIGKYSKARIEKTLRAIAQSLQGAADDANVGETGGARAHAQIASDRLSNLLAEWHE